MLKKTIPAGSASKVLLKAVDGDLRVTGWDRDEVAAKTDGDVLDMLMGAKEITITCDSDLILSIPRRLALDLLAVSGDTDLRELPGGISVRSIEGDLSLRMVGAVSVGTAMGDVDVRNCADFSADVIESDFSLRDGSGNLAVRSVQGDVSLNNINGNVSLGSVSGDLFVRGVSGNLSAHAEEDAVMYLQPLEGNAINVEAEGDILLHMPAKTNAAMSLEADDAEDIYVEMPGLEKSDGSNPRAVMLGTEPRAAIRLKSEGDLRITSRESDWASAAEFDFGGSWPLPADFNERINHTVQHATRQAEAAIRRVDQRFGGRSARGQSASFNFPSSGRGPSAPVAEPVSDEERMTVLRMLEEKKISAEDAEKLLSALGGGE